MLDATFLIVHSSERIAAEADIGACPIRAFI
jgi:hypothetical protein